MRFFLTVALLAVSASSFAQKKELRSVEKAIDNKQYAQALTEFKTIDPSAVEDKYAAQYHYLHGITMLGNPGKVTATQSELNDIKESFTKAIKLDDSYVNTVAVYKQTIDNRLFQIAEGLLEKKEYTAAAIILDDLHKDDPTNLEMLNNAAKLYYGAAEYDLALDRYIKLYDSGYTGETTTYGATKVSNGEKVTFPNLKAQEYGVLSKEYSTPTIEKSPSIIGDIVLSTVWLYKNKGELDTAKAFFDTATKQYPNDASLNLKKADIYLQLEMMEEYKKASEEISSGVKDPKIFDNLAEAAQNNKDWDQVIKYYNSSLEIEANNYAAQVNISNAYIQKGNLEVTTAKEQEALYKLAIDHLEKANVIKPKDANIVGTLMSLYDVFKMTDKATSLKAQQ